MLIWELEIEHNTWGYIRELRVFKNVNMIFINQHNIEQNIMNKDLNIMNIINELEYELTLFTWVITDSGTLSSPSNESLCSAINPVWTFPNLSWGCIHSRIRKLIFVSNPAIWKLFYVTLVQLHYKLYHITGYLYSIITPPPHTYTHTCIKCFHIYIQQAKTILLFKCLTKHLNIIVNNFILMVLL